MGSGAITADDPREEVRIVERLNYDSIETAWQAGYDSAEWRRTVNRLADRLIDALQRAEVSLASRETERADEAPATDTDIADMLESLQAIEPELQAATDAAQRFVDASSSAFAQDLTGLPPAALRARLLGIANELRKPSLDLERAATDVYREVAQFDAQLRGMLAELAGTKFSTQIREGLRVLGDPASFDSGLSTMKEVSGLIRMFGALNVSVRKSVSPAVIGINAFVKTVETVQNWAGLVEPET